MKVHLKIIVYDVLLSIIILKMIRSLFMKFLIKIVHSIKYRLMKYQFITLLLCFLIEGLRVRRHRISKNDQNEPYNWRDLNLGQNLAIYGTVYRICDCDRFTRVKNFSFVAFLIFKTN